MEDLRLFKVNMDPHASGDVKKVLESGYIGQGEKVEEFEKSLETILQRPVLTTNSCTSALDLALHLCDVGPDDEVISSPMTCTATNSPIINKFATIVWADIDPLTGMITRESIEEAITDKTKAIMAVSWGGYDLPDLSGLGIPVIQDAAHCFGQSTAYTGDYITWSFQAIKFLTTGDGGALSTPEYDFERARLLRWYGLDRRSSQSFRCDQNISEVGYKYHMNDISATIGLANTHRALASTFSHIDNVAWLNTTLSPVLKNIRLTPHTSSSHWVYFIHTPRRAEFIEFMKERGIETSLVHARNDKHLGFAKYSFVGPMGLKGLEAYAETYIAIPCGWWISATDLSRICEALIDWDRHV